MNENITYVVTAVRHTAPPSHTASARLDSDGRASRSTDATRPLLVHCDDADDDDNDDDDDDGGAIGDIVVRLAAPPTFSTFDVVVVDDPAFSRLSFRPAARFHAP